MKAVTKFPGKPATVVEIDARLKSLQRIVDGPIDGMSPAGGVTIYIHHESALNGMARNVVVPEGAYKGTPLFGALVLLGANGKGQDRALAEDEAEDWRKKLDAWAVQ